MTKIKICGLTRCEDTELVNSLKIDYAGFVLFFPKSKRNLEIENAARLIKELDGIKSVAVTVSPTLEQTRLISKAGFDFIQIHGELADEAYEGCDIPIIRAFNKFGTQEVNSCGRLKKISACLFDAHEPGSGKTFDWDSLKSIDTHNKPLILAGGLNPTNVSRAIEVVRPNCVDVSSGVELPQGGKDTAKAKAFVEAVRMTDEKLRRAGER